MQRGRFDTFSAEKLINLSKKARQLTDSNPPRLEDSFGRQFEYLRLSVTDRCNFRCAYCLPNGFQKVHAAEAELSVDEMRRAVRAFSALGVWKLRLTGGEPTVHPEFETIASALSNEHGIRHVGMTTNGYRLAKRAAAWRAAGVKSVNVSIDSLDSARFAQLTGHDRLGDVLEGVDEAIAVGLNVKINSVLLPDTIAGWSDILEFIQRRDVCWRFIELMKTNGNVSFFDKASTEAERVRARLDSDGWSSKTRKVGNGPAIEYTHSGYRGQLGLIAPYTPGFCSTCNRLRLSSRGRLHLCLFGEEGIDLRPLLQQDSQREELMDKIRLALTTKSRSHRLNEGLSGSTPHLASIGG